MQNNHWYSFKKHPEFNLVADFILNLLFTINDAHPKTQKYFVEKILPLRDSDPIEYYKQCIEFIKRYNNCFQMIFTPG